MIDFIIKMKTINGQPRFVLSTDLADITEDAILETAVIISLFTDRQADEDDEIPDGTNDRRGWWGDMLAPVSDDKIGSRLWLLSREKQTEPVRKKAEYFVEEATEHLIEDDNVSAIQVEATFPRPEWLGINLVVTKIDGSILNLNYNWEAFNGV